MPSIYNTAAGRPAMMPPSPPPQGGTGGYSSTSTGTTTTGRGLYGNLPTGIFNAGGTSGNNAYVRNVQGNELTSQQLNGLIGQDSEYMRLARQSGMDMASARGLGNSSIAVGNSQRAAIQSALPIAQADAGAYMTAAGQNQDALNQNMLTSMNNQTALGQARIGANASMYGDDLQLMNQREGRAFSGEQQGLDRAFRDYLQQLGHSQNVDMANLGYQHTLGSGLFGLGADMMRQQQGFYNNAGMYAMNNPAIMSNPEAFGNYMNFISSPFSGYIDNIFANLFGGP